MAIVPAPYVDPPEPRGPRYGLLTAANGPLPLPPHGSGGGVRYEPVSCGRARRWDADCEPLGSVLSKTFDGADPTIVGEPVTVYATYTCGTAGKTPAAVRARVLRRLANGEQTEVEEHLGQVLAAAATPVAAPDPTDAASVVGALEQWLYGAGVGQQRYGNVGYLHLPPRLEGQLATDMVISKAGPLWVTPMGTVVVLGGGYPDDGSVYITGTVTVWRGEAVVPDTLQTLDRDLNLWMALAEREYVVTYDCLAAVATLAPAAGVAGTAQTALTSASRTSDTTTAGLSTGNARGVHVVIDVTSTSATPSVTPYVEGHDPLSGKWYQLLAGGPVTAVGTTVLKVYPGIQPLALGAASDVVPATIRVRMDHADADPITYSVSVHYME